MTRKISTPFYAHFSITLIIKIRCFVAEHVSPLGYLNTFTMDNFLLQNSHLYAYKSFEGSILGKSVSWKNDLER